MILSRNRKLSSALTTEPGTSLPAPADRRPAAGGMGGASDWLRRSTTERRGARPEPCHQRTGKPRGSPTAPARVAGCSRSRCSARGWSSSTGPSSTWRCRGSAEDFGAETSSLQWILNGYMLTLASLILLGGSLGDRYGRRRIFVVGVAWFTAASLLCAHRPERRRPDRGPAAAGSRRCAAHAGQPGDDRVELPAAPTALGRSGRGPGSAASQRRSGRCSAAGWSRRSRGGRSS